MDASTVATATMVFLATLSMIAVMMIAYGIVPTAAVARDPIVFAVNVLSALAVASPVTLVGLWFRKLRVFVLSVARAMFLAPGRIPLSQASDTAERLLYPTPLTGLFEASRSSQECWQS